MPDKRRRSSRDTLRDYFLANVGRVIHTDELRELTGVSQYGRRIRELRADEGYQIETHRDQKRLKPGEYVLVSAEPKPVKKFSRNISKEVRARVLDRNGNTCQMCGIAAGEVHPHDDRRAVLQIGHIVDRSMGGSDDLTNLRSLCSVCNEGAANVVTEPPSSVWLLAQVRRATEADQARVLEWLEKKFRQESGESH